MRDVTLCLLIKESEGNLSDVLLAMKKRGYGMGRWNGVGGKVVEGEDIIEAAIREAKEEIGILPKSLIKVAELEFNFPHNPDWDQRMHTYLVHEWEGDPEESEEMKPAWFSIADVPLAQMWSDDAYWLPHVLEGKLVRGSFIFGEGDLVTNQEVQIVETF